MAKAVEMFKQKAFKKTQTELDAKREQDRAPAERRRERISSGWPENLKSLWVKWSTAPRLLPSNAKQSARGPTHTPNYGQQLSLDVAAGNSLKIGRRVEEPQIWQEKPFARSNSSMSHRRSDRRGGVDRQRG
ncbi:hypothetical protein IVA96_24695 [Bradyrhizobium sp. 159]|uniref:hypothetical protein n=1 Tax=Bradyrhizobium sp. 159 TaxID=2782632 RepID=UPI001FFBE449|nr:hypothetical protein [Bradyrhizobium sp. 159]MCK1619718.1 hypothetical protein [Bradyrhizobium sp. 159]